MHTTLKNLEKKKELIITLNQSGSLLYCLMNTRVINTGRILRARAISMICAHMQV